LPPCELASKNFNCPLGFPEEILDENVFIIDVFKKMQKLGESIALELLKQSNNIQEDIDKLYILKDRYDYLWNLKYGNKIKH